MQMYDPTTGELKPEHAGNEPDDHNNAAHYLRWLTHLEENLPSWDGHRGNEAEWQARFSLAWLELNAPELYASHPLPTRVLELLRSRPQPEPPAPAPRDLRNELRDQGQSSDGCFSPLTASKGALVAHYRKLLAHLQAIIPGLEGDRLAEAEAEKAKAVRWLEENYTAPVPSIHVSRTR